LTIRREVRNSGESHVDHAITKAPVIFDWGLSFVPDDAPAPRFFGATGLSQHEVLEDELAFASEKGSSAREARHFLQRRLGTGFDFDDIIERLAIRARKGCTWPTGHVNAPYPFLAC
jgi:hypothetical protein